MPIRTNLIGRFGNQMFQYAFARKMSEVTHSPLSFPNWVGESIFELPPSSPLGGDDLEVKGYCQDQQSLIYSKKDCLRWFKWRPEIRDMMQDQVIKFSSVAHRRTGDYKDLGYVVVSENSYINAAQEFCVESPRFHVEEKPIIIPSLPDRLRFLPDFWTMTQASYLFRGNSTFSWWASVLGNGDTFCPNIDNIEGGKEQDCKFEHGNHKKFANLECCTDLHMFRDYDRYDYDLTENSVVVDCGGYHGLFAHELFRLFKCFIDVYEPETAAFNILTQRFSGNSKINLNNFGVGGVDRSAEILWKGDMTGEFADQGVAQSVKLKSIDSVIEKYGTVDILKLNIEGGEFEVLEALIKSGNHKKCRHIQVQFHSCVPDFRKRYYAIREAISKTHQVTFDIPWIWQSWTLK